MLLLVVKLIFPPNWLHDISKTKCYNLMKLILKNDTVSRRLKLYFLACDPNRHNEFKKQKYTINRAQSRFVMFISSYSSQSQRSKWLFSNGNMILMDNTTNNIKSSTTVSTNSQPNNNYPLSSSGVQAVQRDNREFLHPKVRIQY